MLVALLTACSGYQPPSGQGYDYDLGRVVARDDIRAARFVYYVSGVDVEQMVALSDQIEANCGFVVHGATDLALRKLKFAEGYNSVSVPAIEKKLGLTIRKAIEYCAEIKK